MYRGTTPTNIINVDLDLTGMTIFVTYAQNGKILFEKTNDVITVEADKLLVPLTQEETLSLGAGSALSMMLNWLTTNGTRGASAEESVMAVNNHIREVIA